MPKQPLATITWFRPPVEWHKGAQPLRRLCARHKVVKWARSKAIDCVIFHRTPTKDEALTLAASLRYSESFNQAARWKGPADLHWRSVGDLEAWAVILALPSIKTPKPQKCREAGPFLPPTDPSYLWVSDA